MRIIKKRYQSIRSKKKNENNEMKDEYTKQKFIYFCFNTLIVITMINDVK